MPGMDGTGPSGQGPMTGGGFGRCNPDADPAVYGGGRGMGAGRGRGNRRFARRNFSGVRFAQNGGYQQEAPQAQAPQAQVPQAQTNTVSEPDPRIEELSKAIEELKAQNAKLKKAAAAKKSK